MTDEMLTVEDLLKRHPNGVVQEGGIYKFVKVNGNFRFVDVSGFFPPGHVDLVDEGETAESAGTVRITHKDWEMLDWQSSTLKVHATPDDADALWRLLARPQR